MIGPHKQALVVPYAKTEVTTASRPTRNHTAADRTNNHRTVDNQRYSPVHPSTADASSRAASRRMRHGGARSVG